MALSNPSLWEAFGSGGFAGVVAAIAAVFARRSGRLARLEQAVEECRRRDADVIVLSAGFRLVVGALSREVPHSPELRMCHDLLTRHLPVRTAETNLACFADVLEALDQIPEPKRNA